MSPPLDGDGNSVRVQRAITAISDDLGGNPLAAKARLATPNDTRAVRDFYGGVNSVIPNDR